MTTTKTTAEQIQEWVINHYLKTGEDCTVKEIAAGLGWSESKVRKAFNDAYGNLDGLDARQEYRDRFSKSYTFMAVGISKVWVYGPSRETLRKLILSK